MADHCEKIIENAGSLQAARNIELLNRRHNIIKLTAKRAEPALKMLLKTSQSTRAGSSKVGFVRPEQRKPDKS